MHIIASARLGLASRNSSAAAPASRAPEAPSALAPRLGDESNVESPA
jgi:hypothetical protein